MASSEASVIKNGGAKTVVNLNQPDADRSAFGGFLLSQAAPAQTAPRTTDSNSFIELLNDAIKEFNKHPNAAYAKKLAALRLQAKNYLLTAASRNDPEPSRNNLHITGAEIDELLLRSNQLTAQTPPQIAAKAKNSVPNTNSKNPAVTKALQTVANVIVQVRKAKWIGNKRQQQVLRFDVTTGYNKGKVGVQTDKGQVFYYASGTTDSKIRQELADPQSLLSQNAAFRMGYAPVQKRILPSGQIVKTRPNNTGERIVVFDEKGVARDFRSLDEIYQSKFFGGRKGDNLKWKKVTLSNGTPSIVAKDGKNTIVTSDFQTSPNGELRATENAKFRNFAGNTSDVAIQNSIVLGQTKVAGKPKPDTLPTALAPSATSGKPSSPLKTNGVSKAKDITPVAPVDDFRVGALADVTMFGFDRPLSRIVDLGSKLFPTGKLKDGKESLNKLQDFLMKFNTDKEKGLGADPLRLEFNTAILNRGMEPISKNDITPIYVHIKLNIAQAKRVFGAGYGEFKKLFMKFIKTCGMKKSQIDITEKLINSEEAKKTPTSKEKGKIGKAVDIYDNGTDIRVTAYLNNKGIKYIAPGYMHVSNINLLPSTTFGKRENLQSRKIRLMAYDSVRFLHDTETGKLTGTLFLLGLYARTMADNKSKAWMGWGPAVPILIPADGNYANSNIRMDANGHYGFITKINNIEKFVITPGLIKALKQFGGNFSGIKKTTSPSIDPTNYLTALVAPDIGSRIRQMQQTIQNFNIVENGADIATSAMTIAAAYEGFRVLAPKTATALEGTAANVAKKAARGTVKAAAKVAAAAPSPVAKAGATIVRGGSILVNSVIKNGAQIIRGGGVVIKGVAGAGSAVASTISWPLVLLTLGISGILTASTAKKANSATLSGIAFDDANSSILKMRNILAKTAPLTDAERKIVRAELYKIKKLSQKWNSDQALQRIIKHDKLQNDVPWKPEFIKFFEKEIANHS